MKYINCFMMKILTEVFMWLHIEQPAATNATLPPAQIARKQNNLLQIQHQCYSFPLYVSLILTEPVY